MGNCFCARTLNKKIRETEVSHLIESCISEIHGEEEIEKYQQLLYKNELFKNENLLELSDEQWYSLKLPLGL